MPRCHYLKALENLILHELNFSRPLPDRSKDCPDGEMCYRLSITYFILSILRLHVDDVALEFGRLQIVYM
jgi:hypothetical protein